MEEQPEKKEPVFISVASLSKEEREEWKKHMPKDVREVIEKHEREGTFNRCPKTDWCAKFNEAEEAKKKQKEQEVAALQKRNAILEAAARQQEAKQKEQEDRLKKAEERMEKMASLLAQLISK